MSLLIAVSALRKMEKRESVFYFDVFSRPRCSMLMKIACVSANVVSSGKQFSTTNFYFYCKAATSSGRINSEGSRVTYGDKCRGRRPRCWMVKNNP